MWISISWCRLKKQRTRGGELSQIELGLAGERAFRSDSLRHAADDCLSRCKYSSTDLAASLQRLQYSLKRLSDVDSRLLQLDKLDANI